MGVTTTIIIICSRRQRHAQFAKLAAELSQLPAPRDDEAADTMGKLWPRMWSVRCRNSTKEVFWRLAGNALPTADRIPEATCIYFGANPPRCTRAHIFWQCPMAQAVVGAVQSELRAWSQGSGGGSSRRRHRRRGRRPLSCERRTSGWRAHSRGCLAVFGG
jgi:hypothetical protein